MKIIDDLVSEHIISRYGNKANSFDISHTAIIGPNGDNGISILKMLKNSSSKSEFVDLVDKELNVDRNTDFYHFTLLFGKFIGTYNLYNYLYIKPDVLKDLNSYDGNFMETVHFLNINSDDMYEYFNKKYSIDKDDYNNVIDSLFTIHNNYTNYNNPIIKDIGKVIFGSVLYDNMKEFPGTGEAIRYFDIKNNLENTRKIK